MDDDPRGITREFLAIMGITITSEPPPPGSALAQLLAAETDEERERVIYEHWGLSDPDRGLGGGTESVPD